MSKNLQRFLDDLGARESGGRYDAVNTLGYLGKYQMGELALIDAGYYRTHDGTPHNDWRGRWTGRNGVHSAADFLKSPMAQEGAMRAYTRRQWGYIRNLGLRSFVGKSLATGVMLSRSGMLAGAHLLGVNTLRRYVLSDGTDDAADAYGTRISEYVTRFADYDLTGL